MEPRLLRLSGKFTLRWSGLELLSHPETWLGIVGNALPLLGVLGLGWDASTLVIFYWLETALIGFWLIVRILATPRARLAEATSLAGVPSTRISNIGLAAFVFAHAGIFMAVHMFFLATLLPGEWRNHLGSPADFIFGFVVPSGIWLPLAGLFIVSGLIAILDIRHGAHIGPVVTAFYLRIVVMQFVIILGGMLALAFGGTALLVLLVLAKTGVDLFAAGLRFETT